jgi:dipeptidyl aminopeptidase/acylaminoacyl peptidase
LKPVYLDDKILFGLTISPDGRFISYRLVKPATNSKNTIVPAYVTESGFTEDIPGRTKVGAPAGTQELFVFDTMADSAILIKTTDVPGIKDIPEYLKNYPTVYAEKVKKPSDRIVSYNNVSWSPKGTNAILEIYASDYKDRWIMLMDPVSGKLSLLDRQHDSAWISGPGIGGGFGGGANSRGWINENTFWYQSEVSGYSHLYTVNTTNAEKKALTTGNFEVQQSQLSRDKKYFYIATNEAHPGEQQFYRLPVTGGKPERITTMTGANQVSVSPDEKTIAFLYSYSNKPWELFIQDNKPGGKLQQVTSKAASDEFKSYSWRDPELITFTARDGATVYARLYRPANAHPSKPAVIFVHGAGYLQNAHKWWSSYFREYMFHNLLADNGYTVLDIDYRASAGYGRDWRTGIYRFMGGKDLTDNVDGAKLLVEKYGVDPKHIGVYGGSYGGFITLMALFTQPGVFKAGAALRPVTDWANYNHGYTANILNEPFNDSIAYKRSSPIYFANGLKDHLLICHGMMDVNVHFQDAIKLTQRLIELGKDNWEIAPYPMEDHGFIEPSSWTDEYKRYF